MTGTATASLVDAAAAGEQDAWTQLVTRFGPAVRSVARGHRLNDADQEEVFQRTFLRLLERINSLRDPEAVGGWLVTTARRESLRIIAKAARELPSELPTDRASNAEPVEEVVIAAERRGALYRALDRLRPRQRSLLRLQLAAPTLSYEQVGGILDMPVGAIGPTRGRAFARLREDAGFMDVIGASCRPWDLGVR
jgi:RNA polymerase sigma factor (sigma-70 family)